MNIKLSGMDIRVQIVPAEFPIKNYGILGVEFLKNEEATIPFPNKKISVNKGITREIPFVEHTSLTLFGRSKNLIKVKLYEKHNKFGYVTRIDMGPRIFAGECIVSNQNGFAYICTRLTITRKVSWKPSPYRP